MNCSVYQCPVYSFEHGGGQPGGLINTCSQYVCLEVADCWDTAWNSTSLLARQGQSGMSFCWGIFSPGIQMRTIPPPISENLSRFKSYFGFKLLQNVIYPGFMFHYGIQCFFRRFAHTSCNLCDIILFYNFRCNPSFCFHYGFKSWKKKAAVWNSTVLMICV